jgi:hypothetical protein
MKVLIMRLETLMKRNSELHVSLLTAAQPNEL